MPDATDQLTPETLAAIREKWLRQCGPCDIGLVEYGCQCPDGDYRPAMSRLLHAFEALQRENADLRAGALHRLVALVPSGELRDRLADVVAQAQREMHQDSAEEVSR